MNPRLETCKKCEKLIDFNRCSMCGCFIHLKTISPFSVCPLNKWKAEPLPIHPSLEQK